MKDVSEKVGIEVGEVAACYMLLAVILAPCVAFTGDRILEIVLVDEVLDIILVEVCAGDIIQSMKY